MRPIEDLKRVNAKALVITAHPDDETLFAGGIIAEFTRWRWTILCVTDCDSRYNKRRRSELLRACRAYAQGGSRVKHFMLAAMKRNKRHSKKEIKKKIGLFVEESGPFDIVFTHNKEGDYGHKTHKLVHSAVKELKLRNVYSFSLFPLKGARKVILSLRSRRTKKQALNIYLKGSQKTNLSKLKGLVAHAANSDSEWFIPLIR